MKKHVNIIVAIAVALVGTFGLAEAGNQIHKSFDLPTEASFTIQTSACSAAPGPQISLEGALTLTGLNTAVIFRNTGPQVPQEPVIVEQVVVPANDQFSTPAQTIVGGLGANPYLWIQIEDAKGRPLTSEMFLGRCEQGSFTVTPAFAVPVEATGTVIATDCAAASGPTITLDGATQVSPLTARLIFRSDNATVPPHGKSDEVVSHVVILPEGRSYPLPTQPIVANSMANPLVSMQFNLETGIAVGSPMNLGRCASLSIQ